MTGNWKIYQMVKKFPLLSWNRKRGLPQYPKGIFQKITDPFDFQPKFLDFFLLNGKQPLVPLHHMRARTELLIIFTNHFKPQRRNYCHFIKNSAG